MAFPAPLCRLVLSICFLFLSLEAIADRIVLGSFSELARAENALLQAREVTALPLEVTRTKRGERTLYRLIAGPFDKPGEADQLLPGLRDRIPDAWIDRTYANDVATSVRTSVASLVLGSFGTLEAAQSYEHTLSGQLDFKIETRQFQVGTRRIFRVMSKPDADVDRIQRRFADLRGRYPDSWIFRSTSADVTQLGKAVMEPSAGVVEEPSAGVVEAPSAGVVEEPSAGVVEAPSAGVVEAPSASAQEEPVTHTVVVDSRKPRKSVAKTGWVPEGFEDLLEPQTTQVDVYFGDVFLTSSLASYTPTEITLFSPDEVMTHLSDVLDPDSVLELLSGSLPTNSELVCFYATQTNCGELETESLEVIFDESRFRLDVFLAPSMLAVRDVRIDKYLPPSSGGLSLLNQLSATVNGSEGNDSTYNIGNSTTLSFKETRLLAISNVTREDDFTVDTLALEREIGGQLYQAGYFRSSGLDQRFITEEEFAGITVSSSLDTRTDLDQSFGNDLQVFLDSRSRLDLFKDGRLISTAVYDAGNQIVDTSSLPGGAYDVVLRIRDSFGRTREETRFYVKTTQLPPKDQLLYFLNIGETATRTTDSTLPETTGDSLVRAGVSRRLTNNFGGSIGITSQEDEELVELGFFQLGRSHELNLNLAAGAENDRGLSMNGRFRWGLLAVNMDYRRIWIDEDRFGESLMDQSSEQGSLSISYRLGRGTINLTGRYNQRGLEDADKNVGFRYDFPDWILGRSALETDLQLTDDNGNLQALFTMRFRFDTQNWRHQISSQYYHDEFDERDTEKGFINNVSTSWNDGDRYVSDVNWNLRGVNEREDDSIETDIEVVSDYGRVNADVVYARAADRLSWGASVYTNIIASRGGIGFGGREQARSALVMDVDGEVADASFNVMINGSPRANAKIGKQTVIGIQPYRTYEVSLVPMGDSLVDFNNQVQTATLYPGNVVTMNWKAARILVVFGQLVSPEGDPIQSALLEGVTGLATTDEFGFFQAEIESDVRALLARTKSHQCEAVLPDFDTTETVVMFEKVVCR